DVLLEEPWRRRGTVRTAASPAASGSADSVGGADGGGASSGMPSVTAPPNQARQRCCSSTGGGYLPSQALTLDSLAFTHFSAAWSGVSLSTAIIRATAFWSSLVHWKFLTRS